MYLLRLSAGKVKNKAFWIQKEMHKDSLSVTCSGKMKPKLAHSLSAIHLFIHFLHSTVYCHSCSLSHVTESGEKNLWMYVCRKEAAAMETGHLSVSSPIGIPLCVFLWVCVCEWGEKLFSLPWCPGKSVMGYRRMSQRSSHPFCDETVIMLNFLYILHIFTLFTFLLSREIYCHQLSFLKVCIETSSSLLSC